MINDILTTKEAADILRVSTLTIKRYIKQGKIKAIKLSTHTLRIPASEIEHLYPKNEAKSKADLS